MTAVCAIIGLAVFLALTARGVWREAGRIAGAERAEEALARALHAHDQDIDALTREAGLPDDQFVTAFRRWQARQQ